MTTSTTLKFNTTPFIQPITKHSDPASLQPQIFEDLRVTNMSLHSIILECSLNKKRVVNSNQNSQKTKYVPIKENVIAQIYSKNSKDLRDLQGAVKSGRRVELIQFNISENKEVTNITIDKTHYVLLKAKGFFEEAEDAMSREIHFLDKYINQPGILPIIAQYSYISKSSRKNISSAPKNAIITRRLQDVHRLLANPESHPNLLRSTQHLDYFKKEAKTQLLKAVITVHSHGDVHRDIKLGNTLWEIVDGSLKFYIIDFDRSLNYSELNEANSLPPGTFNFCDPQVLAAICEASKYRDRAKRHEIRNKAISQKNDIFSLGLMFYLLRESTHRLPNSIQLLMDEQGMFPNHRIHHNNISSIDFFRSPAEDQHLFKRGSFEHLVWRMLRPNQRERITAQEAFEELARINHETR